MAIYSFNSVLLSAAKASNPPIIGAALSADGVNVISLSTGHVGIAFNTITPLASATVTLNVAGSVFVVDRVYSGSTLAIVNAGGYTTFPFLSTVLTVPGSAFSFGDGVSTPDSRRMRHLGY